MKEDNQFRKTVGERINTLLAEQERSQKELAEVLSVRPNVISYFCKGTRTPNTEQIYQIAKFFGVSSDYLLGLSKSQTTDDFERAVCDYTGFSEKALKEVFAINLTSQTASIPVIEILNHLLEKHSDDLLEMSMLVYASTLVVTENKDASRSPKELTNDQNCDLIRYKLSEKFTRILDELDRRIYPKEELAKILPHLDPNDFYDDEYDEDE